MFEQKINIQNPNLHQIIYDVSELFEYIDSLADLGALVYIFQIFFYFKIHQI